MGLVGIVLEFSRTERNGAMVSDVKTDPGGGALLTSDHFQTAGVDSSPLPNDFAILSGIQGTGRLSATGYLDPKNLQASLAGEWRAYSRDPSSGDQVAQVWIKNDGSLLLENDNGYITLGANGVVDINGCIIGVDGNITTGGGAVVASDVTTSGGISLDGHTHPQGVDSADNTQAETGAPS
jgi:hypothetical protein